MSIPTVYINASSKKALNERIAKGHEIAGDQFTMSGSHLVYLHEMPAGTVVKIYEKFVGGNPYAKAYGNWNGKKVI